jgi:hypothetical protein
MPAATFNPAAGTNSPFDGRVYRGPVTENFATIIAGAGSTASATDAGESFVYLSNDGTAGGFGYLVRSAFDFDLSTIPTGATIVSATLSLYGSAHNNGLGGTPTIDIVSNSITSTSNIATSDYGNFGSTPFGQLAISSWNDAGYNDISLNASGLTAIKNALGSVLKLGARISWDTAGSFTGTLANDTARVNGYYADQGSNKPKLVITYSLGGGFFAFM